MSSTLEWRHRIMAGGKNCQHFYLPLGKFRLKQATKDQYRLDDAVRISYSAIAPGPNVGGEMGVWLVQGEFTLRRQQMGRWLRSDWMWEERQPYSSTASTRERLTKNTSLSRSVMWRRQAGPMLLCWKPMPGTVRRSGAAGPHPRSGRQFPNRLIGNAFLGTVLLASGRKLPSNWRLTLKRCGIAREH